MKMKRNCPDWNFEHVALTKALPDADHNTLYIHFRIMLQIYKFFNQSTSESDTNV